MHLTVGYLATPTGDDGVALASALAKTFDAEVDVVLVVREELADGHPARAKYQHMLVERGKQWVAQAISALADSGVTANSTVLVGESFAESLIGFAEEKDSDLIVVGGARVRADPGQRSQPADSDDLAGVGGEPRRGGKHQGSAAAADRGRRREPRGSRTRAARCARHRVTGRRWADPRVGTKKLKWGHSDILVVGSSRMAPPRRIFLGSTAARILAGTDAPVIVVPREDKTEHD